jgi:hypothetical protein
MSENIRDTQRSFKVKLGGDCFIKDTSVASFHPPQPQKKVKHPRFMLNTPFGIVEKEFVRVICLSGGKMRRFLADKVTGTLYNRRTGRCLGSPYLSILKG